MTAHTHPPVDVGLVIFTICFGLAPLAAILWGQWKRRELGQSLLGQDEHGSFSGRRLAREGLPLLVFYGLWCFGTVEALLYILAGNR